MLKIIKRFTIRVQTVVSVSIEGPITQPTAHHAKAMAERRCQWTSRSTGLGWPTSKAVRAPL